ncbi:hypothetical protein [Polyangium fumosum]|uniref:Chitin-binding type-2 domain-containing protein n=1 Tax=Polyangium fumosum TaxID=889272 RepID=A0A4U1IVN6_9BACT|nr:hypothetical protein [Polyangium fumosum]TKC98065.1 hypothetical protein E8A74_42775 [Polyangium fumosum]
MNRFQGMLVMLVACAPLGIAGCLAEMATEDETQANADVDIGNEASAGEALAAQRRRCPPGFVRPPWSRFCIAAYRDTPRPSPSCPPGWTFSIYTNSCRPARR